MDIRAEQRLEELQRELDDLRAQLDVDRSAATPALTASDTGMDDAGPTTPAAQPVGSRRGLLRLAAGAAAGGAAAVVVTSSGRVAANDGDPVEVGAVTQQGDSARTATVVHYVNAEPPRVGAFPQFFDANVLLVRDDPSLILLNPNGSAYPAAIAGYANSVLENGLYGFCGTGNHGVVAYGSGNSIGLLARGGRANAQLYLAGDPAPERGDAHEAGELIADEDGDLWYCTADGSPGTWVKLNQPPGSFVPIDPVRVFDSRQDAYPESGVLGPNESKTISVADGRDLAGDITSPDAVPEGATAVAFNVTVTGTTGPNFVSVVPGDAPGYTTSSINWSGPDQSLANGSIVKLDDMRQVRIFGGDQTGSTHVVFDITGYYV